MPVWRKTIYLSGVWKNPDLTYGEMRDAVVRKIRRSGWPDQNPDVADVIDALSHAKDAKEFDTWWAEMYELADQDRVWIDLVSPVGA